MDWNDKTDYLGFAAESKHKAKAAIKEKQFDKAWGYLHQQKEYYAKHANRSGFKALDALALIGSVDQDLADVLRLEGKHEQALLHISYAYATSRHRTTKELEKKLSIYFTRCKLSSSFEDFHLSIKKLPAVVDFFALKNLVDNLT
jgi:hypothetical protein